MWFMATPVSFFIRGGRVVDPIGGLDGPVGLLIRDGHIAAHTRRPPPGTPVLDARGLVVAPGFLDLHVHLREPGNEEAETVASGCRAAARGGFTGILAMPNTRPPCDTQAAVARLLKRAEKAGLARVYAAACATQGRRGRKPANLPALARAGALAFTDDGSTIRTAALLQRILATARRLGLPVLDHAESLALERRGVMHAGAASKRWNLPGIPAEAEVRMVRRDIAAAEKTGGRLHVQHLSAAGSVALLRAAQRRGVPVTAEVTPHHLALTDADVDPNDANYKMNPPLRSATDREALLKGICDGTISVLATDHAPHTREAKARGFLDAPPGVIGLETAVGVTYSEVVLGCGLSLVEWIRRWTSGPAAVVNLPAPTLAPGAPADLVVLDLTSAWTVRASTFATRSRNTPFEGRRLTGRALLTLCRGRVTWRDLALKGRLSD